MLDERISQWLTEIRVLDGGFGSECQKRSKLLIDGHKAWSSRLIKEDPNLVCDIHKSFLRAGCDVISTNTYQAAPRTLAEAMDVSTAEAKELMHHAVRLARRAITAVNEEDTAAVSTVGEPTVTRRLPVLVAGSLGSYGACMADGSEYTGSYVEKMSMMELVDFHLTRAETLLRAGVDLLAWETIPAVTEVSAICEVMRQLPGAVGWLSVASTDGQTTVSGDPLYQVAAEVQKCDQIFAVGVNCNIEFECIGQALANLNIGPECCSPGTDDGYHPPPNCGANASDAVETKQNKKILILYPNSGELWIPLPARSKKGLSRWVWPKGRGPSTWIKEITKWAMRRGEALETSPCAPYPRAQWVGGCCRVSPEQVKQLAEWMKPDEFVHFGMNDAEHAETRIDEPRQQNNGMKRGISNDRQGRQNSHRSAKKLRH